jgi:hypothetical protein
MAHVMQDALDHPGRFGTGQAKPAMDDVGKVGAGQRPVDSGILVQARDPEIRHFILSRPCRQPG